MALLTIVVGTALLFFGRRVFWLFVAGIGFVAGMTLAASTFNGPEWLNVTIGLIVGMVAALLAVFVQRFAIGLAGFLGGGYLAMQILPLLNLEMGWLPWALFIVGGIIGVILVNAILDWALIILSTLAGSLLIIESINLPKIISVLGFLLLLVIGISIQAKELKREKR